MLIVKRVIMKQVILASASPRRREILEMLGFNVEVRPSECDENIQAASPEELVMKLSGLKCQDVAGKIVHMKGPAEKIILGADTIVVSDKGILGKPSDEADAFRMLKILSGKAHTVFTGVTIIDIETGKKFTFAEHTEVIFYDITDEEIREYIGTGEPMDKAGAYGIQGRGAFLVKEIRGDFYTVMGLPAARVWHTLRSFNGEIYG